MSAGTKRKLRIAAVVHEDLVPPDTTEGLSDEEIQPWKMEYDVITTLRSLGHTVRVVGLYSDLDVLRNALKEFKPHIAFNLLEEFHGVPLYDQHIVSLLELMRQPYTGCNPRGLTLAHDKALSKKILAYHQIPVPRFAVFPVRGEVRRPPHLEFPLFVKSLIDEGSVGISRDSVVYDDEKLVARVELLRQETKRPVIVEQYIEGREIYASVIGNHQVETLTPWELIIKRLPKGTPNIATSKLKWDYNYQKKVGVETRAAILTKKEARTLDHLSKQVFRNLGLSGYARLDFRLSHDGVFYLLEANPNPNISYGEDMPEAADHAGLPYEQFLSKILALGLSYKPMT